MEHGELGENKLKSWRERQVRTRCWGWVLECNIPLKKKNKNRENEIQSSLNVTPENGDLSYSSLLLASFNIFLSKYKKT